MNFMAPDLIGDTITAIATVTEIDERRRRVTLKTQCLNGDKVVIDGEAQILVPRRDAAKPGRSRGSRRAKAWCPTAGRGPPCGAATPPNDSSLRRLADRPAAM